MLLSENLDPFHADLIPHTPRAGENHFHHPHRPDRARRSAVRNGDALLRQISPATTSRDPERAVGVDTIRHGRDVRRALRECNAVEADLAAGAAASLRLRHGDVEHGGDLLRGLEFGEPGCRVRGTVAGRGDEVVGDRGFDEGRSDHEVLAAFTEQCIEGSRDERLGQGLA